MVQIDDVSTRTIEQLWLSYSDELLRSATVLVGPSDASDVVADAFMSAARSAVKSVVRDPRAYMFRAVANRAYDLRRSRQRRWSRDLSAVTRDIQEGPDNLIDVRRAVADLSIRQRAVNWTRCLGANPKPIPAHELYSGEHWTVVESLRAVAHQNDLTSTVWICSAASPSRPPATQAKVISAPVFMACRRAMC